jgi:hypothetical protein
MVLRDLRIGIREPVTPASRDDLGEVALRGLSGVEQRACLKPGGRDRVEAERSANVGIGLEREDLAGRARRRFPGAHDQGGVDVAHLETHESLEERPGSVHLDVGLVDRRPGSVAIHVRDECKGSAREIVTAAGNREVNLVPVDLDLLQDLVHNPQNHRRLGVVVTPVAGCLREGDDRDVFGHG